MGLGEKDYLGVALVQAVYLLYDCGIGKGQDVWTQPDNVAMFLVQVDHGELAVALGGIVQPPPVCICGQERAGVLVQAIVELVADEPAHDGNDSKHGPVIDREMEKALSEHFIFFLLFLGSSSFSSRRDFTQEQASRAGVAGIALFTRS